MARAGSASAATEVGADMGGTDSWRHLGPVALSCFPVEQDAAKRRSFTPFFVGSIAVSVIVTPLFNASRGSVLLPALVRFLLINPAWPDAQPYDSLVFVAAALLVVWFNREAMLNRDCGVTEVIPQAANRLPHLAALSTRP
jgi:hypothetical protein